MKRYAPYAACIGGIIVIALLLPRFNASQPLGIALTRGDAREIAKRAARDIGVPIDKAWETVTWRSSFLLMKELRAQPQRRAAALADPVIGPRLDSYYVHFYRKTKEKGAGYGHVFVNSRNGEVVGARHFYRDEESGPHLTEAQLRPRADAFVQSRSFPGAPSPQFESARSTVIRNRTDWVFRYRVASSFFGNRVVPYLNVYFAGDRFAGWELRDEYADGHPFEFDGSDVGVILIRFVILFAMLIVLLVIFLKKYHAGEVGVGTASMLFAVELALMIVCDVMTAASMSETTGMGLDAPTTALAMVGFKFVLLDVPLALVVFLGWSVGESYARERWGERLASLDAILRRDPLNATVGRSLLRGVLTSPAVAACAFLAGLVPLLLHQAWPSLGGTEYAVSEFGPSLIDVYSASDAIVIPVVGILFVLAWAHRRRVLWLGIVVSIALGVASGATSLPIQPWQMTTLYGFGGIAACVAVFLAYDLLSTVVALFGASVLVLSLPLVTVARGHMLTQISIASITPLVVVIGWAVAALMTRREVVYSYEDLAPHVKRIVERERVKAEIDAANRIQAALLPIESPQLAGASVASHYRAATEIGGDYFDFLSLRNGEMGIAFGDVSGHGLTSGIVMAMAKAALLVQVEVDPSPRAVMNVLNDIVIKTAPKRIMMTFFFGVLDSTTQQVRFSSAGHLDPYVYRANGKLEALSSWGFPLGVRRRDPFREHVAAFAPGDRLILYSDGLIEALDDDGNPFGFDRFEQVLRDCGARSAEEIKNALLKSIRKFTRNRPPEDDQTLVVLSFEEDVAGEAIA
jgi:hypothetical protein